MKTRTRTTAEEMATSTAAAIFTAGLWRTGSLDSTRLSNAWELVTHHRTVKNAKSTAAGSTSLPAWAWVWISAEWPNFRSRSSPVSPGHEGGDPAEDGGDRRDPVEAVAQAAPYEAHQNQQRDHDEEDHYHVDDQGVQRKGHASHPFL